MKNLKFLTGIAFICLALISCNDDTLDVGSSLTNNADKLEAFSATYNVQSRTILADSVLTRSNACYLGRIIDPETGAYIASNFMTQLHILESFSLPKEDSILSRADGKAAADSCVLSLYLPNKPSSYCDSLAAMRMRVTELSKPLEEGVEYYSNFDLHASGYLRNDGLTKDKMFSYVDLAISDSARESLSSDQYKYFITIPVNQPYTDKDGKEYKNYGTYVMQQYYHHPEYFKNSYQFIHNVCPGFFFEITDGFGFHSQVPDLSLRIYYTRAINDSTAQHAITLAGTDEILQTTRIDNDTKKLQELVEDNSCTYIKSPAGLYTEVTMPIEEIMNGHENDSLLAARITFQRINNDSHDTHTLDVPSDLLMLPKDSLTKFFLRREIYDNITSFRASFSTTSNIYAYSNISTLVMNMAKAWKEGTAADRRWAELHPDWNKVVLVPVTVTSTAASTYSTAVVTNVAHSMKPTSTRLVGGSSNTHEPLQLKVVYAKFSGE